MRTLNHTILLTPESHDYLRKERDRLAARVGNLVDYATSVDERLEHSSILRELVELQALNELIGD